MPSPEHAADLERLLTRAAQECESKRAIWFGEGLPRTLQRTIAIHSDDAAQGPAELGFIEVCDVSPRGLVAAEADTASLDCPLIGLSAVSFDELGSLIRAGAETGVQISQLILPFAVFDFDAEGIRVREIRSGLTAADLQGKLPTALWAGPDLKEFNTD